MLYNVIIIREIYIAPFRHATKALYVYISEMQKSVMCTSAISVLKINPTLNFNSVLELLF